MLDGMMQQQDDVNRIFMGNSLSSIGRELNSGGKNTVGSSGFQIFENGQLNLQ